MSDLLPAAVSAPAPGEATAGLEIRLFGPMEVRIGPHPLPHLRTRKGLWLLALLALRAGRPVERGWLAGTLWPDCDDAHALRSLRQSLHDLRLALGPEAWRLTSDEPRMLRLDGSGASVDVLAFDAALARTGPASGPSAQGQWSEGVRDSLEAAVRLYRGPFLEDCVEEWSLEERQRREQAYVGALERLAAAATARQEPMAAASYLRLAVGADSCREDLQRALMEALVSGGNPAGALAVYRQFRALLWRDMAAEPAEETTALFRRLREETRARARPHVPEPPVAGHSRVAAPAPGPRGNLPRPLSGFVGRERELLEIGACLAGARLVTLTGTGGIGKTRLAIQVAEGCAWEYANGAWFVDLAALAAPTSGYPALVPQAVARALRVQEVPGVPLTETLQEALSPRQLLLVLDNCEHLIDACARLAEALLSGCPQLRILATSRQALGLTGEILWPVPPLSVPGVQEAPPRSPPASRVPGPARSGVPEGTTAGPERLNAWAPERLMQYEAIHLFVERADAAATGFALGERNAAATVQVCQRLDGIPLAIELAAARLRTLSIEQIAARLDDRLRLLTGGSRAALPRQQTLRATLDWSYELLSEPERILLQRLSVFSGGFTLEAAEAVCSGVQALGTDNNEPVFDFAGPERLNAPGARPPPLSAEQPKRGSPAPECHDNVLDLLTSLVDRSLVGVEPRDGAARYVLLEMTRDYARERLREAEADEERRARHGEFFLALAERAEPELRGAAQAEWLQRLDEEHANFHAAIEYFLVEGPVEEGLRLGGALGWFWWMRGYVSEGRERLQALLAQSGCETGSPEPGEEVGPVRPVGNANPELRQRRVRLAQAKVLNAAGMLADDQSDYETARTLFEESLALCRDLDDQRGAAFALNNLGGQARHAHDYPAARALYEESLALWRGIGDQWGAAAALTNLGRVALYAGEYAAVPALVESALEIQRQLQDRRAVARSLTTLGMAAARMGDYEAAQALHTESLSIVRELGAKQAIEETLEALGSIASERGDRDAALAFHDERLAIAREMGSTWGMANSLYHLGLLARERGESSRAGTLWSESLAISRKLGDHHRMAECLEGFASLATQPSPMASGESGRGSSRSRERGAGPGDAVWAARLFGAATALRERFGSPVAPRHRAEYERQIAAASVMLDAAAFAAAWAEGRAMTLDEAIRAASRVSPAV